MFENIDQIKKHINVSKYLDFNTLKPYVETALREKIFPMVGSEFVSSEDFFPKETLEKIEKATANYAVAYAIPFLKMHLSNTGANTFSDGKTERSPWWDIRDYGLNAVAIADRALSDAIFELQQSPLKDKLPIFNDLQKNLFASPFEFSKIYSIGDSYEVFLKLIPIMDDVWRSYLSPHLPECSIEILKNNPESLHLLKKAVAYFTLADAVLTSGFTFTKSAIVIQWEQLPWQKSQTLQANELTDLRLDFLRKAKRYTELLLAFIEKNADDFPCFAQKNDISRKIIQKKSGLYL